MVLEWYQTKIVETIPSISNDEIYKMLIFFERRRDVILVAEHGTKYFLQSNV